MNILIVKLSALGDIIHALPVSYALRQKYPDAHITWVVEPAGYEILKHNPYIDEIVTFNKKDFKSIKGFFKNYPSFKKLIDYRSYDISLDLQGLFKSGIICMLAGAQKKIGCADMREGANLISKPIKGPNAKGHIVDRYLDVATSLGAPDTPVEFPWNSTLSEEIRVRQQLGLNGIDKSTPYVVLAVGTNWENKCWSPQYFGELVNLLHEKGIEAILIGYGAKDEERANKIMEHCQEAPINLVGQNTLGEIAVIIRQAQGVIGGDTGNLHLAAALKVPAIMLMGPTNPERNGPYNQLDNVILAGHDCDGCWQRKCPKNIDCLATITPDMVMEKLDKLVKPL